MEDTDRERLHLNPEPTLPGAVPGDSAHPPVPTLAVEHLQELLERGARITVLDIRPTAEREEWHIPQSLHHDAYAALRAGDPSALREFAAPDQTMVVTVCAAGRTSVIAAALLRERGYDAYSLAGGMKAWSLAWNAAELTSANATLVQVRRTGKGCLSYVAGSGTDAVVVDASLDPEVYLRLAESRGWVIRDVLETHIHADHLSRSRRLSELAGARLWLPEQQRVRFEHRVIRNGGRLSFGSTGLVAIGTPGHTLESTSYVVDERWLLTGDTLFPTSVGRSDLESGIDAARERAIILHASLRRLLALAPHLLVLPGHTSGPIPFDRTVIAPTLETVRRAVSFPDDAAAFADFLVQRIPPTPPHHDSIISFNEAGELPEGDPTDLEAGANRCAVM